MFGLTIKSECTTAAARLLADHQIELTKAACDPFIERFDHNVLIAHR